MILKLLLITLIIWTRFIKTVDKCNPNKKRKVQIIFDDMIPNMLINKIRFLLEENLYLLEIVS